MKFCRINEDNRKLLKYLGFLFLIALLTYQVPHRSYSILEYLIRPVKMGSGVLSLSGIVVIILFIIAVRGLFNLEWFKHTSKILIFIGAFLVISPLMRGSLDIARTAYYWVKGSPISSVDLKEANMGMNIRDQEVTLKMHLDLVDYGTSPSQFSIRVYFPEKWQDFFDKEYYDLEYTYYTYGYRNAYQIQEEITLFLTDGTSVEDIFSSSWHWETFKYELHDGEDGVLIKDYGYHDFAVDLW